MNLVAFVYQHQLFLDRNHERNLQQQAYLYPVAQQQNYLYAGPQPGPPPQIIQQQRPTNNRNREAERAIQVSCV